MVKHMCTAEPDLVVKMMITHVHFADRGHKNFGVVKSGDTILTGYGQPSTTEQGKQYGITQNSTHKADSNGVMFTVDNGDSEHGCSDGKTAFVKKESASDSCVQGRNTEKVEGSVSSLDCWISVAANDNDPGTDTVADDKKASQFEALDHIHDSDKKVTTHYKDNQAYKAKTSSKKNVLLE